MGHAINLLKNRKHHIEHSLDILKDAKDRDYADSRIAKLIPELNDVISALAKLEESTSSCTINSVSNNEVTVCPECDSTNLFDLDTKMECEDCGFEWQTDC